MVLMTSEGVQLLLVQSVVAKARMAEGRVSSVFSQRATRTARIHTGCRKNLHRTCLQPQRTSSGPSVMAKYPFAGTDLRLTQLSACRRLSVLRRTAPKNCMPQIRLEARQNAWSCPSRQMLGYPAALRKAIHKDFRRRHPHPAFSVGSLTSAAAPRHRDDQVPRRPNLCFLILETPSLPPQRPMTSPLQGFDERMAPVMDGSTSVCPLDSCFSPGTLSMPSSQRQIFAARCLVILFGDSGRDRLTFDVFWG